MFPKKKFTLRGGKRMTLLNEIINQIKKSPDDNKLYLIEKCSDNAGYFVSNKKFIYMAKNLDRENTSNLQTDYLLFRANVKVVSVENSQNFYSGFYNLIEYKMPYSENLENFESFINLCSAHIRLMNSRKFVEFFKSLINLFQIKSKEKSQNIYGLFGELSVIYDFYKKYNINLAPYWHTEGIYSKYDFSNGNKNFEVKTSSSLKDILIKHSQIFNDDENYLIVALVENNNSGISLKELEKNLLNIESINADFDFIVNLESEKLRISASDYLNKKLKLISVDIFDCKTINPLTNIPKNISEIEYRIDLTGREENCTSILML